MMRWVVNMRSAALRLWRGLDWGLVILAAGFLSAMPYYPRISLDLSQIWRSLPMIGRATSPPERFLEAIRDRPPLLRAFLQQFPKGGNLHVHLSGAVYLESLIEFARATHQVDQFCVAGRPVRIVRCEPEAEPETMVRLTDLVKGEIKPRDRMPSELQGRFPFQRLIDALSLRNFDPNDESSPDQFFGTFSAIGPLLGDEAVGHALKELQKSRNAQGLQYFEVMVSLQDFGLDRSPSAEKTDANKPFDKLIEDELVKSRLRERGIPPEWLPESELSPYQTEKIDEALTDVIRARAARVAQRLDDVGLGECSDCSTDLRFIQQLNRASDPQQFYAQLMFARELLRAQQGRKPHRVVGLNIVSPEHGWVARVSVLGEMAMLRAVCDPPDSPCHHRVALHAGELAVGMVPPAELQDHIAMAVDAGARRIGHGVMIGAEATRPGGPPFGLFDTLARKHIAVEINLSSNREILHIRGPDHPLRDYIGFSVPVVVSTDDEGINRSDVTNEWMQAVSEHHLAYGDLVRMARNSLEYSFLEGDSLWEKAPQGRPAAVYRRAAACRDARLDAKQEALGEACRQLLESSDKARHQLRLENALADFAGQNWDELRRRSRVGLAE
jgi:hypothetical protein